MSKIAISGASTGSATFTIESPATSTNRTLTLPDSTGTVVVSGTTPSLNGITFPATQVASAGANTLDDYEEGTFNLTLLASTSNPTVTYTQQAASYVKIGSMVSIFGRISTSAVSGGSGTALIGNLPFAVSSTYRNGAAIGYVSNVDFSAGNTQFGLSPDVSQTTMRFVQSGDNISATTIAIGAVGASLDITFSFTYQV